MPNASNGSDWSSILDQSENQNWDLFDQPAPAANQDDDSGAVSVAELQNHLSRKARSLLLKAEQAIHEGKPDDCLRFLQAASKERSASIYIPGARGAALLLIGKIPDAIDALNEAVTMMPISANYSNLGLAYLMNGEVDHATQDLRRALDLRNSPRTRYLMGLVLLDSKPGTEIACDDLQQAREAVPAANLALAVCYARDGQQAAANNLLQDYLGTQRESAIEYWRNWVASVASETQPSKAFGLPYHPPN